MIIKPFGLALAGLLLGGALIGCGNSGESTPAGQKPRESTFRPTRTKDTDLQGEKPNLPLRAMKVFQGGQEASPQPKPAGGLMETRTWQQQESPDAISPDAMKHYRTPAESRRTKRRRIIVRQEMQ